MRVKLNISERVLLRFGFLLSDLSFNIGQAIHRKYDPDGVYNTHTYNGKKCREIIFSNEEES